MTRLLRDWAQNQEGAFDRLLPIVLGDLRRLARHHLACEGAGHTLQPTDLIHETYLRLVRTQIEGFDSRTHFFAFASRLMREILVEHARARRRRKRGGDVVHVPLDAVGELNLRSGLDLDTILAVHEALSLLEGRDPRQSKVAELRFFAGLTLAEVATVMNLSLATVERLWSIGRRRLARALSDWENLYGPTMGTSR